jgi:hypothetical protein
MRACVRDSLTDVDLANGEQAGAQMAGAGLVVCGDGT